VPSGVPPSPKGNAARRSSPATASSSIAADGKRSVCASRAEAPGSAERKSSVRSSTRAISAARSAAPRRSSASIVRDRARAATELSSNATASKIVSAAGPSGSAGTKLRDGGTWKKSNAAVLNPAVTTPSASPQTLETTSTPRK
jgi:hypothetical protein